MEVSGKGKQQVVGQCIRLEMSGKYDREARRKHFHKIMTLTDITNRSHKKCVLTTSGL